jgi:aspartate/glutamate racemase
MTPRHIGILACSAEGAALCYRTICTRTPRSWARMHIPRVTVHTFSLAGYMACIYRGNWASVGELMLASANKLKEFVETQLAAYRWGRRSDRASPAPMFSRACAGGAR